MALPGAFPFPPHLVSKDDVTHLESVDPRGKNKMTSYLCIEVIHVSVIITPTYTRSIQRTQTWCPTATPLKYEIHEQSKYPPWTICKSVCIITILINS